MSIITGERVTGESGQDLLYAGMLTASQFDEFDLRESYPDGQLDEGLESFDKVHARHRALDVDHAHVGNLVLRREEVASEETGMRLYTVRSCLRPLGISNQAVNFIELAPGLNVQKSESGEELKPQTTRLLGHSHLFRFHTSLEGIVAIPSTKAVPLTRRQISILSYVKRIG